MTHEKLTAAGLFAVAAALLSIAWAIHDHSGRYQRYQLADARGLIFDTVTGEILACTGLPARGFDNVFDKFDPQAECRVVVAARR